jgi:DNA-binding MarR family transcriptional regulator
MTASRERTQRRADPSGVSRVSNGAPPSTEGVMGHHAAVVTAEDVDWLVVHLQAVVAANCAVWAGRGLTLVQLTALHLIGALAPVSLLDLAHALGTNSPATSAMVDRLAHAGLVCRTLDLRDRRRVQLTLTAEAEPIIGDTDPDTARRLQAVLTGMSLQARRHVIDMLIDTVRRSAEQPSTPTAAKHLSQPSPGPVPVPGGSARGPDSASVYAGAWGVKISSDIASLRGIRQRLATWARTTGLSSAAVDDLVLAS